jgi:hypothetical protein
MSAEGEAGMMFYLACHDWLNVMVDDAARNAVEGCFPLSEPTSDILVRIAYLERSEYGQRCLFNWHQGGRRYWFAPGVEA